MFTGLIEEVGAIQRIDTAPDGAQMTVICRRVLDDVKPGDSIAVDGVCTTVVFREQNSFTIEASVETLAKTILGTYQPDARVNLERPLLPASRLGGHFVTGHVDGTAILAEKTPVGIAWQYRFQLNDPALAPLLVSKGSVAVSGVSLTVNGVEETRFHVMLIPHTLVHTTLADLQPGDAVNIETDLLGKYVARLLQSPSFSQTDLCAITEAIGVS